MRIPRILHKFASPRYFYQLSGRLIPWTNAVFLSLLVAGLYIGLRVAPTHSEQGESYRILYIHVPAASNSLMVYMVMAGAGLIYLVWRIKLADIIAASSAPIGASFTFLALVTGSIWGKPTWGTWWQWDARLTSELILLFLYLGYMALRAAIEDQQNAARASAVLGLVGVVNIPIIHYSVEWWNTLHQGATITKFSTPSMQSTMLTGLLLMMSAIVFLFATSVLVWGRCKVLRSEIRSSWVRELPPPSRNWLPLLLPGLVVAAVAYHAATTVRPVVLTPTQFVSDGVAASGNVFVQGTVEAIKVRGIPARFVLSDGKTKLDVEFRGTLPPFFRTEWGARVQGRLVQEGRVFEATTVEDLNIRDHRRYVLAAYLIAFIVIVINMVSPHRCHKQARLDIARRIRREENAT